MKKPIYIFSLCLSFVLLTACGNFERASFQQKKTPLPTANGNGGGLQPTQGETQQLLNQVPWTGSSSSSTLTVMSYNFHGIPCQESNLLSVISGLVGYEGCPDDTWYSKNLANRLNHLLAQLKSMEAQGTLPEVLMLQEFFRSDFSQIDDSAVIEFLSQVPYGYRADGPASKVNDSFTSIVGGLFSEDGAVDSGLVILSNLPILASSHLEYGEACALDDCGANKGALHARIQLKSGQTVDLFNTHHQAFLDYENVRIEQNQILLNLVQSEFRSNWAIMGGDFNFRDTSSYISFSDFLDRSGGTHVGQQCLGVQNCQYRNGDYDLLDGDVLDHQFVLSRNNSSIAPQFVLYDDWIYEDRNLSDHDFMIVRYLLDASQQ